MRYFRSVGFSLVLFLFCMAFISSQDKDKDQEKPEKIRPPLSLIRKDLLVVDTKKLDPPKRNIFTPNSAGRVESAAYEEMNERRQAERQNMKALESEQPSSLALNLRYIGYVKSGQKITALILFGGEALAVDVGEEIAGGVSISIITLEDITVIGSDQETRKFPLEGEKR